MKYREYIFMPLAVTLSLFASNCSDREDTDLSTATEPILLAADYQTTSRASDAGFADQDCMGIYITDYEGKEPQPIGTSGNRANNAAFTYHESENKWTGSTVIYWKDHQTPVDIVGYYPFDGNQASVTQYAFTLQSHQEKSATQQTKGGYEASDLLWAKNRNVAPTTDVIRLTYNHLMAGITIRLVEGSGFAEGEWESATRQVWVDNTILQATVNLEKGEVKAADGEAAKIIPLPYNNEYRAVVVPQQVAAGKPLIGINLNGTTYQRTLNEAMTYTGGKMHTFTIEVIKRTESGTYEFKPQATSITDWIDDPDFHDGLIREYIIVDVATPGTLQKQMEAKKLNYQTISNLKLTGKIDWKDLSFMGSSMPALSHLNLSEVRIDDENDENDDVITGFEEKSELTRIVLPSILRGIGNTAFRRTNLTGTLEIPEGVTFISYGAFMDCPFHAEIKLPSTLKSIGGSAFAWAHIEGELHLPEGLETIGGSAFAGQKKIQGSLRLPQSLKAIGEGAFSDCNGLTGDLVIPQGTEVGDRAFTGTAFSHIELYEGVTTVGNETFVGVPIQGELLLPSTLTELKDRCFQNTKISSVVLPSNLRILEKEAFADCSRLQGVINIPEGINVIPEGIFSGCTMLSGVHLHKDIVYIAQKAFSGCTSINTLVCDATIPPVVEAGAFDGISKDNFSIEVPAEAVSAYKLAEGWREFKRITAYKDFVCRPDTACALNKPHEETLVLNADGPWEVSQAPDWCEVSPTSGTGKSEIRLIIEELAKGGTDREGEIVFSLTGTAFTTQCAVRQKDYEYDEDEVVVLQNHSEGNGIDILFLGDGYNADDLASGAFIELAKEEMEYFFGLPPFDRLRNYFNVYAGISLSQETGINTINTYRNTRFGTFYSSSWNCKGEGPRLVPQDEVIFPYITDGLTDSPITEDKLNRTLVILIPNTSEYDGITYQYSDNRAISICPPSVQAYPRDSRGVVQREACGYGFAKLGNESITRNAYAPATVQEIISKGHENGWYQNLSATAKMSEVPWAHLIFHEDYSNYVDIFEGGMDYTRNIYRSESQSCMSTGIPYLNAISRQAVVQRIKEYAGEKFSLEEFYANDTTAWGNTDNASRSAIPSPSACGKHEGPVVVNGKYIPNKLKRNNK